MLECITTFAVRVCQKACVPLKWELVLIQYISGQFKYIFYSQVAIKLYKITKLQDTFFEGQKSLRLEIIYDPLRHAVPGVFLEKSATWLNTPEMEPVLYMGKYGSFRQRFLAKYEAHIFM